MRASDKSGIDICYSPHLTHYNSHTSFDESTRVLVRPIGLDMVEVGGSTKCDPGSICHRAPLALSPEGRNRLTPVSDNPPGPTKFLAPVFI